MVPGVDPFVCLAILHSRAFLFFYRVANQGESRVIPQVKASKLYALPFPLPTTNENLQSQIGHLAEQMLALHKQSASVKTAHERTALARQIEATDREIDRLVYELYGLTDEEIRIVEEATNSLG